MRKSKFLIMILALILTLALVVACGDNNGDDDYTPAATPPADTTDPVEPDPVEPDPVEPEEPAGPVFAEILRAPGLIYSLETDGFVQSVAVNTMGVDNVIGASVYLEQAGSPSWTVVEGGANDTNAIRLTNREQEWYAVDIQADNFNWDIANNQYLLTVRGNIQGGGEARINGADGPWETLAYVDADGDGDFTVSLVIDAGVVAAAGSRGWFRVQSDNTSTLTIYEIRVVRYIPRPEGVVYSLSTDGFVQSLAPNTMGGGLVLATPNLSTAGAPTYTAVEGPYGMAVRLTNREENWHAVDIITGPLDWDPDNNTYLVTVTGHLQGGGTAIIGGADGPWDQLSTEEVDADGYFVVSLEVTADTLVAAGSRQWFRIQSNCTSPLTVNEITIVRQ